MKIRTFFWNVRILFLHKLEEPKRGVHPEGSPPDECQMEEVVPKPPTKYPRTFEGVTLDADVEDREVEELYHRARDLWVRNPGGFHALMRRLLDSELAGTVVLPLRPGRSSTDDADDVN